MKRRKWRMTLSAMALPLLLLLFPHTVRGESADSLPEEYVQDFIEALPPEGAAVGDAIREDRLSDFADMSHLCRYLFSSVGEGMDSIRGQFLTLTGLVIFLSAATLFRPEGEGGSMAELGVTLVAALLLFRAVHATALRVGDYLGDMQDLANVMAPVMCVLQTAGGNGGVAAVLGSGLAYFFVLLENLCAAVLLPLARVCFGFAAVGAIGTDLPMGSLLRTVKHTYTVVLGLFSTLLTASLALQSSLSAAADSMRFRTVRYAVGNMIPVVGGTVSGSLQTAAASLTVLRHTVGVGGVIVLILLLVPMLIELLLTRLLMSLAAAVTEMTGAVRASRLFGDVRGIYDMMIAVTVIPSLLFLFIVTLFARTVCAMA